MDQETLSRSIEPFFSTKGVGKGTGLGLAMVHGFLLQSGGALVLTSQVGKGTIADLWIPISSQKVERSHQAGSQAISKTPLKVLVVDDEPLLTMTTADMLTDLGHTPFEAGSGAAALEMLKKNDDIDLMITDHAMPGMSGVEPAKQAVRLRPSLKIIIATGYNNLPKGLDVELEHLPKPYFESDLAAAIDPLVAAKRR